jgi:hypothetical protein
VSSFTHRPLYLQGQRTQYPLDRRLGGPQNQSGSDVEEKNSLTPPGIEPQSSDRSACSQSLYRLSYLGFSIDRYQPISLIHSLSSSYFSHLLITLTILSDWYKLQSFSLSNFLNSTDSLYLLGHQNEVKNIYISISFPLSYDPIIVQASSTVGVLICPFSGKH